MLCYQFPVHRTTGRQFLVKNLPSDDGVGISALMCDDLSGIQKVLHGDGGQVAAAQIIQLVQRNACIEIACGIETQVKLMEFLRRKMQMATHPAQKFRRVLRWEAILVKLFQGISPLVLLLHIDARACSRTSSDRR